MPNFQMVNVFETELGFGAEVEGTNQRAYALSKQEALLDLCSKVEFPIGAYIIDWNEVNRDLREKEERGNA